MRKLFLFGFNLILLFGYFSKPVRAQTINAGKLIRPLRDFSKKELPLNLNSNTKLIPIDSAVKIGRLKNGLIYYIRKNQEPRNRAELRLVVNAGSVLENDNQLGLAHFTEHMAFNGTRHFQKNDLISFLEKSGVKFGADLNAHTNFDETVYQLSLPTDSSRLKGDSSTLFEKGFLILEDWAHALSFNDQEIDKERGVVIEEWRLGRGANARFRDQYFPVIFKGSRYASRLPIGNKPSLDSFSHAALKQFYSDWYRPDLQAIIVVGDVDIHKTEALIKLHFSSLKNPATERIRTDFTIPSNTETRISILTDKEQPYTIVQWVNKIPKAPDKTLSDYQDGIRRELYNLMVKDRIAEILHEPNAPFLFGSSSYNSFLNNIDVYQNFVVVKGGKDILRAVKTLVEENLRIKKFGFTESELARAKKDILSGVEKQYEERDKTNSKIFVNRYVENFLHHSSIPGLEFEFHYSSAILNNISLNSVNDFSTKWLKESDRYAIITAPEKEKANLPNSLQLLGALNFDLKKPISPYRDKDIDSNLLTSIPLETKVFPVNYYPTIGVEEIKLQNGMRILLKPTHFKNNQILFTGFRKGGTSNYSDSQYLNAVYSAPVVEESGVSDFDAILLSKMLAGKEIRVNPYMDEYEQGYSGSSTVRDLETSLQLLYLYFTKPRKDVNSFTSMMEKESGILQNRGADPATVFSDSVSALMSGNNIRNKSISPSELGKIKLDSTYSIFQQAFSNPSQFTFTFVGNFEPKSMKALLSKYLGNLPAGKGESLIKDDLHSYPIGKIQKTIYKGSEPKSQVRLFYTGNVSYNPILESQLKVLLNGLDIKLRENLREDKSGTYGVGVYGGIDREPRKRYHLVISFGCAPENVERLIASAKEEIEKIKIHGLETSELEKIKAENKRSLELLIEKNEFWLHALSEQSFYGDPLEDIQKNSRLISLVTREQTKEVANQFFDNNVAQIVLKPEEKH